MHYKGIFLQGDEANFLDIRFLNIIVGDIENRNNTYLIQTTVLKDIEKMDATLVIPQTYNIIKFLLFMLDAVSYMIYFEKKR